ncbi:MAG: hypothetical protein WAN43_11125 [Rhodomicrobium sp.]|jgi:hypothetical protein
MKAFKWRVLGFTAMVLSASSTMLVAGDDTYFGHSDFITRQAGDAVAANIAAQTIDPWPKQAKNRKLDVDGKRAEVAMKLYEQNRSIQPRGLGATTSDIQQTPVQQPPPPPQQGASIQN